MSIARKITKNTLWLFTRSLVERIIGFFVSLIVVRYLGSGNFGKYSLVYAYLSFFQVFVAVGIDYVIFRELSRDLKRGAQLAGNAVTLKFFFSLIGIVSSWIVLQWMHYPADIKLLIYIASLGLLFSWGTLFNSIFLAESSMEYIAGINIAAKAVLAVFTIALVFLKAGLFYFVLLNLLIYMVNIFATYFLSKRLLSVRIGINLAVWGELLKYSLPLIINIIFVSIYTRVDQIMLFHFYGDKQVGLYAAAVKLTELPLIIGAVFITAVFPMYANYAATSPDLFKKVYEASLKYLMIFFGAVAMLATVFSREIILICYGRGFLPAYPAVAVLGWSAVFISIYTAQEFILLAKDLQYLNIVFTSCFALVNFILNLILIPRYSFMGAAVANLIPYILLIPLSYSLKKTRIFAIAMAKSMIKPVCVGLSCVCLIYFLPPLPHILKLIFSIAIYVSILLFVKGIDAQDFRYARQILAKDTV